MSLERTNYGLSNEHLFYDVSLVVYCEGKLGDGATHDEMFWGRVFSAFGITCVCKSRGSKTSIVPLALRAIEGNVENVVFAMDRDYGDFHGFPISDRRVIYTFGYSWENDVLLALEPPTVLALFAPVAIGDRVGEDYRDFMESCAPSCSEVAILDIRNALTTRALFDREKPASILVGSGQDLRLNLAKIGAAYAEVSKTEAMAATPNTHHDWLKVFFGKACARLVYQWFVDRSQAYSSRSKVPYDAFIRLCISMMRLTPAANARDQYYAHAVAGLVAKSVKNP